MRINVSVFCIAFLLWQTCNAETKKSWSWGNTKNDEKPKEEIMPLDDADLKDTNPRSFTSYDFVPDESEQLVYVKPEQTYNGTDMSDQIVDAILTSTRQGRNLQEYDEVYSDPDIQDALQKGNDVQARQLIRERLCSLGLMKCDEVSPDEVIYAQPVAIKPVGEPIASVPVRGPPRAIYHPSKPYRPNGPYGSSKPLANVPPRRGYGPTPQIKPPYLSGSAGFIGASSNLYDGPVPSFSGKPYPNVEYERPYKFEQIPTKIQITPNGNPSTIAPSLTNGAQQHVHHHFHHAGDSSGQLPTIVVNNPVPVSTPVTPIFKPTPASVNLLTSGHLSGVQGSLSSLFSSNTKPVIEHSGPQTFGSSSNAPLYSGNSQNGFYGSGGSSFGSTIGSFGSSAPFYKKELNINNGIYNGNAIQPGLGTYANGYQEFDSNRVENYDCVCVPIQQCPSQDVIGRKEDLYLNIDPRHLNSDIEAEDDNSTIINGTSIRITKEINKDDKVDVKEEKKQITKREVSESLTEEDTTKSNVEPRVNRGIIDDNYMKKVEPTFGVSFGLPHQGGGGYPLNPFGAYPLVNPYGSSVGGSGINLGLVSVNPLLSVQVSKDSYGKKVIKPFVNLHVTPNDFLVGKIGDLFAYKKHLLFNKHEHFHHHHGHRPHKYHHYAPAFHVKPVIYHHKPTIVESPEIIGPGPVIHTKPSYIDGPTFSRPPPGAIISTDGLYGPPRPPHSEGLYGPPSYHHSDHYDPVPPYSGGFPSNDFFKRNNDNDFTFPGSYVPGETRYAKRFSEYANNKNNVNEPDNTVESNYYKTLNQAFAQSSSGLSLQHETNYNPSDFLSNSRNGKSLETDDGHPFDQSNTAFSSSASSSNLREAGNKIKFPTSKRRRRRDLDSHLTNDIIDDDKNLLKRQAFYQRPNQCGPRHVCCRRPSRPIAPLPGGNGRNKQCGSRHAKGINGRIKTPAYIDGDSEFGEYPWQVAILKKDSQESVYVCGGTLIDDLHVLTAAHCVKMYSGFDLRVRLGEWDVNHDVEFYPYIERDVISVHVHPEFYAGTLYNDIAVLKLEKPVDWTRSPHISPACLPDRFADYTGHRCWTTGWGKDAFGDFGKYQNILKEVDVPIIGHQQCQQQLQNTRLGYDFKLHPGFVCAGGEEGKDACKGDGGGPMVCERSGIWQVVGIVSWGIGCGQYGVPGVYVKVANYLDWIKQITQNY